MASKTQSESEASGSVCDDDTHAASKSQSESEPRELVTDLHKPIHKKIGQKQVFFESLFGAPTSCSDSSDIDSESVDDNKCKQREECVYVNFSNQDSFTFMHWNVNGLLTKVFDNNFVSFVSSFDFVCLVETFVESFTFHVFPEHKVFCQPAVKLSRHGRPSGGVVCLIRKVLLPHIRQVKVDHGNYLLFVISRDLFGLSKDVLYACTYVPPEGSGYYAFAGEGGDGILLLENCLFDNALVNNDLFVLLSGDLNSRTSNISQYVTIEDDFIESLHLSGTNSVGRKSQDGMFNSFGKSLINMCTSLNLCILNGICQGDPLGCYTYISPFGCSVIDYFLMSCDLFAVVFNGCVLNVIERIESSHMPVTLTVKFPNVNTYRVINDVDKQFVEKFVWDPTKSDDYKDTLNSDSTQLLLEEAIHLIDTNIDLALDKFIEVIKMSAVAMKKRVCLNREKKDHVWFDHECKEFRRKVRRALRRYRRTLHSEDRFNFCKTRREYKNLLHVKKKQFNKSMIEKLLNSIDSQKDFWDTIHKILPKRKHITNNITTEAWFQHFKSLLEKETLCDETNVFDIDDEDNNEYNRPISVEEVQLAVRKLKLKKAAGPDGLAGEFFKGFEIIIPFFVKFFNVLFDKGVYPEKWTESIILPLFKKGDVNAPGNYRGISLSDICSKIFGSIINRRLQTWVEENNVTGEYQAGFKKGYSTVDHMFTLMACVQKQLTLHRKLYVAFIDFQKCFDSINRNLLWPVLLKNGVKGKLFGCIRSMYFSVKARVRCGAKLTDIIHCSAGVKQGDNCSPILFSIFINELAIEVIRQGKHGVNFLVDTFELFILLLADDVVLLSETPVGLQRQLNSLQIASVSLGLKVNMDKSNIVVFRNGGYLGMGEKWTFQGVVMPIVNAYKYLGIYFSTRLSFAVACKDISSKAKRVLFMIIQRLRQYNNHSFDVFRRLFDTQVYSIMQYGAEIWGLDDAAEHCEKVHLLALKKFLSVQLRTPNVLVYRELNRHPVLVNFALCSIRYWFKLLQMNEARIPKKAYLMLYRLDGNGKKNWVTKVRECLFSYGFGYVWINQGVENINNFMCVMKQRLIDCSWQNLSERLNCSDRFRTYNMLFFNESRSIPLYLQLETNRHIKRVMTKFRFGISDLYVHFFRYRETNPDVFYLCPMCRCEEENEIHFVLCCQALNDIRHDLIKPKFYRMPSAHKFKILMSSRNETVIQNLCIFLYKAFSMREIALS